MHINNKAAWVETFTVAESVLSIKTGLSGRGVRNARNELKQKGRIDFRSRVGGRAPIYTIISFETGINCFNKNSSAKRVPFSNTDGNSPEQPKEMNSEEKTSTEMSSAVTSAGTSAGRAGDTSVDRATLIDTDTDNTITKKENKEKEPWVTVLDYFCQKSGKLDPQLKSREREAAQEVCKEVPILETVLKGIDYAFDNFKSDIPEDKINSFCYCVGPIKKLWKYEKSKIEGGKGNVRNSKQPAEYGVDSSGIGFHF
ncbi:hypothetical protein [Clostridium tyrobutyricum]|nr:hypothetical protein [Clostridium tyrobutyricum]